MKTIHTAKIMHFVAIVKDAGNNNPYYPARYIVIMHQNGHSLFDDVDEAIQHADVWVKEQHLKLLQWEFENNC